MGQGNEFGVPAKQAVVKLDEQRTKRLLMCIEDIVGSIPLGSNDWMKLKEKIRAIASEDEYKALEEFSSWFLNL